jgi:hypothetical protein
MQVVGEPPPSPSEFAPVVVGIELVLVIEVGRLMRKA